jgi:hypothetical protein
MNGRTIFILLVSLVPFRVLADTMPLTTPAASDLCRRAIAAAERAHGIPSHLLAAIARVESGRRDQASGSFNPWPWTINADGQGNFYDTKGQAVAAAVSIRSHVAKSIDVGCMQISLTYHPDAFADMAMAFEPSANAEYGARFLSQLYEKSNSWPRAVELYHSATLDIGQEYGRRVYAVLPEEQRMAELSTPPAIANPWAPTMTRPLPFAPLRQGAPHIIPQATGLAGGGATLGRSLDAYRSTSMRFAFRTQ